MRAKDQAEIEDVCEECNTHLIVTPDGTKCCPRCGLVEGEGYSWMGTKAPSQDNTSDQYESYYEKWLERQK